MKSCIYGGKLRHRRFSPVENSFEYPLTMLFLDLEEIPTLFKDRWLWSAKHCNVAWYRRRDYLGEPALPLDTSVRDLLETQTGQRPAGPIRLLTQLRFFGFHFSPVNFYYCYDAADQIIEAIVAEVRNGHFSKHRFYVLLDSELNEGKDSIKRYRFTKAFHVSPFMEMDVRFDWGFGPAAEQLAVQMESFRDGEKFFDATLRLQRRELTGWAMARLIAGYPFVTARGLAMFGYQLLRLWLKRIVPYPGPRKPPSRQLEQ
jgi:DUF1365 family protein